MVVSVHMRPVSWTLFVVFAVSTAAANAFYPERMEGDCAPASANQTLFPEAFHVASDRSFRLPNSVLYMISGVFTVEYYSTFKVVRNFIDKETYILRQCTTGGPNPSLPDLEDAKVFDIPLIDVSLVGNTAVGFLAELKVLDRVKYVTEAVVNACMQRLKGCGRAVGTFHTQGPLLAGGPSQLNNSIAFSGSHDSPLLMAEWIKFLSVFFNKEAEANAVYKEVAANYTYLGSLVNEVRATSPGPVTAVVKLSPTVISVGGWPLHQYIQVAGGRLVDLKGEKYKSHPLVTYFATPYMEINKTGSQQDAMAVLRDILSNVDVLFDLTINQDLHVSYTWKDFMTRYGFSPADITAFKFLRNARVFRLDKSTGPNALWNLMERGAVRPDEVLRDFVRVLTPEASPGTETLYVRHILVPPQMITAADCRVDQCLVLPVPICPYVYMDCNNTTATATPAQRCGPCFPGAAGGLPQAKTPASTQQIPLPVPRSPSPSPLSLPSPVLSSPRLGVSEDPLLENVVTQPGGLPVLEGSVPQAASQGAKLVQQSAVAGPGGAGQVVVHQSLPGRDEVAQDISNSTSAFTGGPTIQGPLIAGAVAAGCVSSLTVLTIYVLWRRRAQQRPQQHVPNTQGTASPRHYPHHQGGNPQPLRALSPASSCLQDRPASPAYPTPPVLGYPSAEQLSHRRPSTQEGTLCHHPPPFPSGGAPSR